MLTRSHAGAAASAMSDAGFSASAALFVARGGRRTGLGSRRFAAARDATAFAVAPCASARGGVMVVGDRRVDLGAIRALHPIAPDRPLVAAEPED